MPKNYKINNISNKFIYFISILLISSTKYPTQCLQPYTECTLLDLVFALDMSRHITDKQFSHVKMFVKNVIDELRKSVGGACIKYALSTFADKPRTHFSFLTHSGLNYTVIGL